MLRIVREEEINGVIQEYGSAIVSTGAVITFSLILLAVYIAFYVLRSIGLYTLAKNQGVDKPYIAFIPCVWMFTACKLIGKVRYFGSTAEKLAVWASVIFSCAIVFPAVYNFIGYFPYVMYYLEGGSIDIVSRGGLYIRPVTDGGNEFNNLFDTPFLNGLTSVLYVFNLILRLAEIFITVSVYIALFRKFWPEHYILAAVLSFLGFFPILIFVVRNRKAVDFNEYIRQRYYGAGFTPYGNRYYGQGQGGRANPYGNGGVPYGGYSDGRDEPFDEFNNRPEEPFGEFDGSGENDKDENDD